MPVTFEAAALQVPAKLMALLLVSVALTVNAPSPVKVASRLMKLNGAAPKPLAMSVPVETQVPSILLVEAGPGPCISAVPQPATHTTIAIAIRFIVASVRGT